MATFVDDQGNEVKAVTAEQHALDNPGHTLVVNAKPDVTESGHRMLWMSCVGSVENGEHVNCDWWNEEGYR